MPVEQQQLAEQAVKSVTAEQSQSRADKRMQRAAERTAEQIQQVAANPDKALRALAYGDKEGLRTGNDWNEAVKRADGWRKKAAERPPSRNETAKSVVQTFATEITSGKTAKDAYKAARTELSVAAQEKDAIQQAKSELADIESTHAEDIKAEEDRFIDDWFKDKTNTPPMKEADFNDITEKAKTAVAAAVQFEIRQMELIKSEIAKDLYTQDVLNDRMASKQKQERRQLTTKEVDDMRQEVIDTLAKEARARLLETERAAQVNEQALVEHKSFNDEFTKALGGVDIQTATPDQVKQARETAFAEVQRIKVQEAADAKQKAEDETKNLRTTPEWNTAYTTLLNRELSSGKALTSELKDKVLEDADREARTQQAEQILEKRQKDAAKKEQTKEVSQEGVKLLDLQLKVAQAEAALAGNTDAAKKTTLEKAVASAKKKVTATINKHAENADDARELALTDPSDKTLAAEAANLKALSNEMAQVKKDTDGKDAATIQTALDSAKTDKDTAENKAALARQAVSKAELQVQLVKNTNLDIQAVSEIMANTPSSATEQVAKALSVDSPDGRKAAIDSLKQKSGKNKFLMELLLTIAAGMVDVSIGRETTA